jgi:hypothetical protein
MTNAINIDLGNDIFEDLRKGNYYVDKSMFIKEFFKSKGHVNLITRPRRFGKSLNLSMLKSYLEINADSSLFEGLEVEAEKEIHDNHFGKYPVLYVSLSDIDGENFNSCMNDLGKRFRSLCIKLMRTIDYDKLNSYSKSLIDELINPNVADISALKVGMESLTSVLFSYYNKQVVILIDEYDSMVTHAIGKGYEKTLCEFLSGFFGRIFKGNADVKFVVLTGCTTIAKESIFTGANNLIVSSVSQNKFSSSFGLTEAEVEKILDDFGLSDSLGTFKEWYNGYLFCGKSIYNTSSVMSYCKALLDKQTKPENYWINSSSNSILEDIINNADSGSALSDLEKLVFGGTVNFSLKTDISLNDFDSLPAMWSVLVHSGYLTPCAEDSDDYRIPNKEVKDAFIKTVLSWVKGRVKLELHKIVVSSIWELDSETLQKTLTDIFMDKMSFHDSHEYAYHMILLGLMADSEVKSNGESGNGRSDITLVNGSKKAAILELKKSYAELYMLADALRGIMQIRDRFYGRYLEVRGFDVIHYGMSFCKKQCFAVLESFIDQEMIESAIGDMEAAVWGISWIIDKKMRAALKRRKKPVPLPPLIKEPDSEAWFPEREQKLKDFSDVLEKEKSNFNFPLLLETTTKLLDDLRWLLKTEEARDDSRTLLEALLTDA